MNDFSLSQNTFPLEIEILLFAAWVQHYVTDRLNLPQASSGSTAEGLQTFTYGDPTGEFFQLDRSPDGTWSLREGGTVSDDAVQSIVDDAKSRLAESNVGEDIVYKTSLEAKTFLNDMFTIGPHFMRQLGDQTPISGRRRLSDRVLLDFTMETPEDPATLILFVPKTQIDVIVFVPGPIASEFSRQIAFGVAEITSAICALAMGSCVEGPFMVFPAPDEEIATALADRVDPAILGLARETISLDIFGEFAALGSADGMIRMRGALLTYHAALNQKTTDVATMLFVGCVEALIVPRPEWRKEKATKRFIVSVIELCPDVIDEMLGHGNVEEAFGFKKRGGLPRQRKELLDRIYELRSDPSHNGLGLSGGGLMSLQNAGHMRVALLSDFARGALLAFIQAPRSSLIGHPALNPPNGQEA